MPSGFRAAIAAAKMQESRSRSRPALDRLFRNIHVELLPHLGISDHADEVDQVPNLVRLQFLAERIHARADDAGVDPVVKVGVAAAASEDSLRQVARPA